MHGAFHEMLGAFHEMLVWHSLGCHAHVRCCITYRTAYKVMQYSVAIGSPCLTVQVLPWCHHTPKKDFGRLAAQT
jgi:hypothetical protein